MQTTHCSECGHRYAMLEWPRQCTECQSMRWLNPIPVSVVLQPVRDRQGKIGIAIARRAIEPKLGEWALIGGHSEVGENAEEAAEREFKEETSLNLSGPVRIVFSRNSGNGHMLLICLAEAIMDHTEYALGTPCPENFELGILYSDSDIDLAFPIHREAAKRFFAGEFDV